MTSLGRVDGTVHNGPPVRHVEEVTQIPWLGFQASPHLDGVDIDKVSELFVDHLVPLPNHPQQVPHRSQARVWQP